MDAPEQIFRDFLRQRRLKYTSERERILRTVKTFGRPFEAEELMLQLREAASDGAGEGGGGRVSKATVYRTLKHLLVAGLIKQVYFGGGGSGGGGGKQAHYDYVDPEAGAAGGAHDYLMDMDTGKIIPFSSELVRKLREEIAGQMGFIAVGHRFQIMGRKGKAEE